MRIRETFAFELWYTDRIYTLRRVWFGRGYVRTESRDRDVEMLEIPETGFLRLPQVLSVIPLGKTCWWEGVKSGRFPKPVKLSARCTAWRAEDIRELIKSLSEMELRNDSKHIDR